MGRNSFSAGLPRARSKFLISLILFSLAFGTTNHLEKSSVEASSPEDQLQQSLPSFDPSAHLSSPRSLNPGEQPQGQPEPKMIPLITPNVFPYQANPIAAIVAAGLTLAVVSLKETGKIDIDGILWLLNNSDYYAGVIGSIVNGFTQQKAAGAIGAALSRGASRSPVVLKPIFDQQAVRAFGNIVNGFTYTFAVSSGFEVFSQFWKYATRKVPEVRTMTGLLKASNAKRKQVIGNLMYLCIADGNMQKRLLNSVYNHRILTYEFIATNVAVYIGGQVGAILAKRYGAGHPFLQRIAPVIGSISGGLLVQLVPDSWKNGVNRSLLEYKISNARDDLKDAIARLDDYIGERIYPAEDRELAGYVASGLNLSSDLDRLFRARDMLNSLEYQKLIHESHSKALFDEVRADQKLLMESLTSISTKLESEQQISREAQINKWVLEKKSPEEVEALARHLKPKDSLVEYYQILIRASLDRAAARANELEGLFQALEHSDSPMPNPSDVIFDMAASNL